MAKNKLHTLFTITKILYLKSTLRNSKAAVKVFVPINTFTIQNLLICAITHIILLGLNEVQIGRSSLCSVF
jgi:hypothetical protein